MLSTTLGCLSGFLLEIYFQMGIYCMFRTVKTALNHNTEVRENIAIVYRNWLAAECRLLSFGIIILTVSRFCIALFLRWLWSRYVCLNFRKDITETKSWMNLRAEDRSKARVISSDDDRSSLAVYAECLPALEPQSDGFFVYRKGWSCQNLGGISAVNAVLWKH